MKLHIVIKSLREDKELTQEQLADKAELTRGYISRMEAGEYTEGSPSIRTLQKIAEGLGVPLELILNKAGITKEDYIKTADMPTVLRAKYDFNSEQIRTVEGYIDYIKNQLKGR